MVAPLCFITVDTEEDNWGELDRREGTVENIGELEAFQRLCESYGAVPTYLVNWPVVATDRSRNLIRDLMARGTCEIGTHCHPWNTPPFDEAPGLHTSWLSNLDDRLVLAKLTNLHHLIRDRLDVDPRTFRAGRWGFGPGVARALHSLGYALDSSVSPWVDWSAVGGPNYAHRSLTPYRFHPDAPLRAAPDGPLVEVAPTIGFYQSRQDLAGALHRTVRRGLAGLRLLDPVNMPWGAPGLEQLGLTNIRWLSPEPSTAEEMIRLATSLLDHGWQWLNVPLHSVTLLPGRTPFVRTTADRQALLDRFAAFLSFARDRGVEFVGLSAGVQLSPVGDQAAPTT